LPTVTGLLCLSVASALPAESPAAYFSAEKDKAREERLRELAGY